MKPKLKLTENHKFYAFFIGLMVFLGAMFVLAALLTHPFNEMIVYLNNPKASRTWGEWAIFWAGAMLIGPFWTCLYLFFKVCEKQMLEYLLPKKELQTTGNKTHSKQAYFRGYARTITLVLRASHITNRSHLTLRKRKSIRH